MLTQFGALPYRVENGEIAVLLVTSRRTGRWVVPKGNPIAGLSPAESAAREAYEEAGVAGVIGVETIGSYDYRKRLFLGLWRRARVTVFPLRVEHVLETWLEERERERQWFTLNSAAGAARPASLQALILGFSPSEQVG